MTPFSTVSPLDGAPLDAVEATAAADVAAVVAKAREAQAVWAAKSLQDRTEAIFKLKDRILDAGDEIARVLKAECGKPEAEAWTAEVLPDADLVEHWVDVIEKELTPEEVELDPLNFPGKSGAIHAVPRGVVALITPWNFPVAIPLRALVPALLAGNAVVFKPSEHSPRSGALVAKLFAGLLPDGLLGLVQGGGDVGAALVAANPDVVVFTGSVGTGRKIAEACARALVPVSLELGGKDAAIVLEDADLERTARGVVWGAFTNAGQNCASIERVYVHEKIAAPLIEKMVAFSRSLRMGDDVGSLTTKAQLGIVEQHVDSARDMGAEVLTGGKRGQNGLLYEPTILKITGDEQKFAVVADETFGPVLPVMIVKDEEDAIRRANASRYGLTASVWTKKHARGEAIAARLNAGVVTINNHGFTAAIAAAPWTGVGESGFGVTNSRHALREMTRPKFILVDKSSTKSELWWMPYSPSLLATVKAMAILRSGTRGIGQKLRALWQLLTNAPKRLMGK